MDCLLFVAGDWGYNNGLGLYQWTGATPMDCLLVQYQWTANWTYTIGLARALSIDRLLGSCQWIMAIPMDWGYTNEVRLYQCTAYWAISMNLLGLYKWTEYWGCQLIVYWSFINGLPTGAIPEDCPLGLYQWTAYWDFSSGLHTGAIAMNCLLGVYQWTEYWGYTNALSTVVTYGLPMNCLLGLYQ